jgi:hypothetical protein
MHDMWFLKKTLTTNFPQKHQELQDVGYIFLLDPTIFKQFVNDDVE